MNNSDLPETTKMIEAMQKLRRACDDSEQGRHKWRFAMAGIGDLLTSIRRARRISGVRMARSMGVSASYLSMLEMGKRDWTDDVIRKWDNAMADLYAEHRRMQEIPELQYSQV